MHRDWRTTKDKKDKKDEKDDKLKIIERSLIRKWVEGNRQPENLTTWMIPSEYYEYKEVNQNFAKSNYENYRVGRSGIIPVVRIDKNNLWLLGSFWENFKEGRILTDFGGKCENITNKDKRYSKTKDKGKEKEKEVINAESPLECALREMREETKGLLNKPIENAIQKGTYTIFEGSNGEKQRRIYFYFVFIDYEDVKDIPDLFLTTPKTVSERLGPLNFYKQSDILSRRYRTARNLTDFVSFLNGYKY